MTKPVMITGLLLLFFSSLVKAEEPLVAPKPAEPVKEIDFRDPIPFGLSPVEYGLGEHSDSASRLDQELAARTRKLNYEPQWGYLRDVLKALQISESSQLMVFSKTALNPRIINPENPRVVYFNDDVYVGWVPGAEKMEFAAVDPLKGTIFYELAVKASNEPRFIRSERCLACHGGASSLRIPGLLVRSFLTDQHGRPISGYSQISHDKPLEKRWGGWYVTGTHADMTHLGNLFNRDAIEEAKTNPALRSNLKHIDQFVDTSKYLNPHSDLVAHLILDHQVHGHNLITRASMEQQLGLRSDVEQQLVRYLLFLDEAPLTGPLQGTTDYQTSFEQSGKRDARGRSLKDFDLQTKLFRHRLSYLIYTDSFKKMPSAARRRILKNIYAFLTAPAAELEPSWDVDPDAFPVQERQAILQIVTETLDNLPEFWTVQK
ncbi:hypothetical protein [Gimesia maris]|uniref:Cytochrome c domain-containing protein n=1 Tax=Gimesia maris TaxID=122 RepID=A0ABX5YSJ8_9PLAN|nr:hypothetical protein [Gimesia maris]QEG18540.1 hypothetical protein GmarT_44300 [Gimesia maris]QGQ28496.1 hypothetical protein F1729_07475 [Gimesia maris]